MIEPLRRTFLYLPFLAGAVIAAAIVLHACGMARDRVRRFMLGAVLAFLGLHALIFFDTTLAYVRFPYEQKSVVEGVTLYNAVQYLDGEQPYHDPTEAPFRSMVYPPVHEMALAGVMGVLGGPTLTGARLFSLLCVLGTVFVTGLTVWRHTRNWPVTLLGGGFFICGYGLSLQWLEQVRNDALLVFLIILGLRLAERAIEKKGFPTAALIILLLGLYTKQTALFAAVAVALFLFLRHRRRAILWAGIYAGAALVIFLALQLWSGGWFAFYVLRVPAGVGFEFGQIGHAVTFVLVTLAALIAAISFSLPRLRQLKSAEPVSLWALAFLLGLPVCLLQGFKWGATMNAFLPLLPLMGILGALTLHRLLEGKNSKLWVETAILGAALIQVAFLHYRPLVPDRAHYESHERIAQWVRAAPGDVLVTAFSSHTYMNGKKFFGDPVIMGDLEQAGLWRGGAVVAKVRRGEFALLVLRPKVEPADLADAVHDRYVLAEKIHMKTNIGGWPYMQVYVPKAAPWRPANEDRESQL